MKFIFSAFLALLTITIVAQNHFCAFDEMMQMQELKYPGFRAAQNSMIREASQGSASRTQVYSVPVVFHVVWNTEDQNLSDEVIESQLEVLNEDFRRLNLNADQTRDIFLPLAADAEIEFYLADVDPEGNPTNGITRTFTERENFELDLFATENTLDEVKFSATGGIEAWDTEHYLNVWVCNIYSAFGQVFGLAYPPEDLDNWPSDFAETPQISGVIVHYTTVGRNNPTADDDGIEFNNSGRTLVHETGHYLGLRHIWGDGFFDGCSVDDGVDDTPNAAQAGNYTCDFELNSCDEGLEDFPDNVENYMDYNQDECMNMFTVGQVNLMRWVLENRREGLIDTQVIGVQDHEYLSWDVYPNPTQNHIVYLSQDVEESSMLVICDALGKLVRTEQIYKGRNSISMQDLPAGVYFLNFNSELRTASSTKKIVLL